MENFARSSVTTVHWHSISRNKASVDCWLGPIQRTFELHEKQRHMVGEYEVKEVECHLQSGGSKSKQAVPGGRSYFLHYD